MGLHPDRVVFAEADKEEEVLAAMEGALSFGGLGAVVGELVLVGTRSNLGAFSSLIFISRP
ncbi:hypothetical protein GGE12_005562 [Rhizobium mongolense]|uniref:Uncharacterized protein n=1 Tax=Rhizobium mongolense TaxID=57676 RepID=A0A7W6RSE3_9HYPH|nr:hypothetical protein [Rhizobium mongolense]